MKQKITIFGESAGAIRLVLACCAVSLYFPMHFILLSASLTGSVCWHLVSPVSQPLLQGAIMESG